MLTSSAAYLHTHAEHPCLPFQLIGFLTNAITPRMISSTAWNWGARGALFYMGTCVLATLWCYFRLPETKGRSFGEIEILFEQKTPARKFASTRVDQFALASAKDGHQFSMRASSSEKDGKEGLNVRTADAP